MAQTEVDLDFFPALREICNCDELIALRARNEERLKQAKRTDRNVFRLTEKQYRDLQGMRNAYQDANLSNQFCSYNLSPFFGAVNESF